MDGHLKCIIQLFTHSLRMLSWSGETLIKLTYSPGGPTKQSHTNHYITYNAGQNYVDTSSRKAFLHINRTPTYSPQTMLMP